MKKNMLSLLLCLTFFSQNLWSYPTSYCNEQYDYSIYDFQRRFTQSGRHGFSKMFKNAYYNKGKGRTAFGSALISAGRIVGASATGAGIGFASPYFVAGLTIGLGTAGAAVPCIALLVFSMGWAYESCEYLVPVTGRIVGAGGAIIASTAGIAPVIGGVTAGTISTFRSVKDSKIASKIHQFYKAQELLESIYWMNETQFEEYYNKHVKRKNIDMVDAKTGREILLSHDKNKTFCPIGKDPMTLREMRSFIIQGSNNIDSFEN